MPFPSVANVALMIKSQLTVAGCPGSFGVGVTGATVNPLHTMVDVMVSTVWPVVLLNLQSGAYMGGLSFAALGGGAATPLPVITFGHLQAAIAPLLPLATPQAAALAAAAGWLGPFGAALPLGVTSGVLMALNASPVVITPAPGDTGAGIWPTILTGILELVRPPIPAAALIGQVQAAWSAHPDLGPGNRALVAMVLVSAMIDPLNQLQLGCLIANPAGVISTVPGTPYPQTLPLVVT